MSINWNNIRVIGGSQNNGFEEFVCQLARKEINKDQKKFYRIGKPDGGKECYWEFADGTIYCWQAKYFTTTLTPGQWTQISKSVTDAIDNHITLSKYYVSIPIDMPDTKVEKKKSLLTKWKEHVADWENYAKAKGMSVEFEFWGSHELISRLSKKENEGFGYFWFNEQEFTDDWFDKKNKDSTDMLGGRYTPELNFELPVAKVFEGLSRGDSFKEYIDESCERIFEKYSWVRLDSKNENLKKGYAELNELMKDFCFFYESINFTGIEVIPFEILTEKTQSIFRLVALLERHTLELRSEEEKAKAKEGKTDIYGAKPYSNELHYLREFETAVYDFFDLIQTDICKIANKPYILLTGEAGIGKSHLLADIVKVRKERGQVSLLLLGENFSTTEMPWTQILHNQLRKNIDEYVFLGALNAKAESLQTRLVIFIDALNEGEGKVVWPKKLKPFINSLADYPWIGLVVSLRSSFENLIAPKKEFDNFNWVKIKHMGFAELEYEASNYFFEHYKIKPPGTPFLNTEFQYPLFLKLFCDGLSKRRLNEVPTGYEGITKIINFFIESVEIKLSQPDQLYYDILLTPVRNAIHKIISRLAETKSERLGYTEANKIVDEEFSGKCTNREPYLKRLIEEGILNTDLYWIDNEHYEEGVHFAYQKFQDHLFANSLLEKHLEKSEPFLAFSTGELAQFVNDPNEAYYQQNIIEAFSVQVPELTGKELYEIAPQAKNFYATANAFIDSLVWRKADTITDKTETYIKQVIAKNDDLYFHFLDTIISNTSRPEFYFNGDWLHKMLFKQKMPRRDLWWTTWLQDKYGSDSSKNAIQRLIDWAWDEQGKYYVSDASLRLTGLTLGWFLTSANRYLRDGATKALVCLFQDRITVLIEVLKAFTKVNDPYIFERLYAVAYGCALRTANKNQLVLLFEYVYEVIFKPVSVYPHILLRDYARGIIEYTLYIDLKPKINIKKVRPPYKSDLPTKFPTVKEIDKKYNPGKKDGEYDGKKWGTTAILNSMTTEYGRGTARYGDFGRYTFESALSDWKVNANALSNYAVTRIFEMGYDPEKFTAFDKEQGSGRGGGHRERIGKKYQWIAFYEILAKVSDNCKLYDESSWQRKKGMSYDGTWYPYVRDIDPSMVIRKTKKTETVNRKNRPWWLPKEYKLWNTNFAEWLKTETDLPKPEDFLIVKDANGIEWVNLQVSPQWKQPKKPGEEKSNKIYQRIWYQIGSWIMTSDELNKFQEIFKEKKKVKGPELSNRYEVFSREYFWSSAWNFFQQYYYGGNKTSELKHPDSKLKYAEAFYTASSFLWEEEYDCSKEEVISFLKPTVLLHSGLQYGRAEGTFVNEKNEVICFDPSVYEAGPSSLLFRKDQFLKFLKETGMCIAWALYGEKQIIGSFSNKDTPNITHTIRGIFYLNTDQDIKGEKLSTIKEYKAD